MLLKSVSCSIYAKDLWTSRKINILKIFTRFRPQLRIGVFHSNFNTDLKGIIKCTFSIILHVNDFNSFYICTLLHVKHKSMSRLNMSAFWKSEFYYLFRCCSLSSIIWLKEHIFKGQFKFFEFTQVCKGG